MKFPYAVKRYGKIAKFQYMAWTPFDHSIHGFGSSKAEALADLKKQFHEGMIKHDGEIGETDL